MKVSAAGFRKVFDDAYVKTKVARGCELRLATYGFDNRLIYHD